MSASISSIVQTAAVAGSAAASAPAATHASGEFQSVLESAIATVNSTRADAATRVERFLNGDNEELHSVILAAQRAELQLELGIQVRNKVVQAYQEIMRMQL